MKPIDYFTNDENIQTNIMLSQQKRPDTTFELNKDENTSMINFYDFEQPSRNDNINLKETKDDQV